jgi:hypothetical protein
MAMVVDVVGDDDTCVCPKSARIRAAFLADVACLDACERFGSCTTASDPPRPTIFPSMPKVRGGALVGFVTAAATAGACAAAADDNDAASELLALLLYHSVSS